MAEKLSQVLEPAYTGSDSTWQQDSDLDGMTSSHERADSWQECSDADDGTQAADGASDADEHRAGQDRAHDDVRAGRGPSAGAGRLPAQQARAHRPGAGRPAASVPAPDSRPAPRGGCHARRRRRDLVHVAGTGPRHQCFPAGARRRRPDAAARSARARPPVPAGRRAGQHRAERVPARCRRRRSCCWTSSSPSRPASATPATTCSPSTRPTRTCSAR